LFLDGLSLCPVGEDFGNPPLQQFFLGIVAQHAHQRRVGVHNESVGRGDVNAFQERFKEFGETSFVFAKRGYIARQDVMPWISPLRIMAWATQSK